MTLRAMPPETGAALGFVSLVGAGPGDPDLITVKGLRRLREAEVVAYDRLAHPALLQECHADTECIYVGKHGQNPAHPSTPQDAIHELLIARARAGRRVVRLKGGDPFLLGRGGEEALALRAAGIAFEIVPGVSSALAVPAYAGIPVTHRGLASSVAVVAGHEDPDKAGAPVDWRALATSVDTLVVLMAMGRLAGITRALVRHGRAPKTPAAVVRWGTTSQQETVAGTLETIAARVQRAGLKAPATLIVGDVVALGASLRWFHTTASAPEAQAPAPAPTEAA